MKSCWKSWKCTAGPPKEVRPRCQLWASMSMTATFDIASPDGRSALRSDFIAANNLVNDGCGILSVGVSSGGTFQLCSVPLPMPTVVKDIGREFVGRTWKYGKGVVHTTSQTDTLCPYCTCTWLVLAVRMSPMSFYWSLNCTVMLGMLGIDARVSTASLIGLASKSACST